MSYYSEDKKTQPVPLIVHHLKQDEALPTPMCALRTCTQIQEKSVNHRVPLSNLIRGR